MENSLKIKTRIPPAPGVQYRELPPPPPSVCGIRVLSEQSLLNKIAQQRQQDKAEMTRKLTGQILDDTEHKKIKKE